MKLDGEIVWPHPLQQKKALKPGVPGYTGGYRVSELPGALNCQIFHMARPLLPTAGCFWRGLLVADPIDEPPLPLLAVVS